MKSILSKVNISINDQIFLKDPNSSDLGRKIISGSIELIELLGFEDFTFKKLAVSINSTEASIYRYFDNKHYLLLYLVHWYWEWLDYKMMLSVMNVDCPKERLNRCINLITSRATVDNDFTQINEVKLQNIVIAESAKVYLCKQVDADNDLGMYKPYKDVVQRLSQIILEISPKYKYPHMLVSTIIEGSNHQRYFATHLPKLTDVVEGEDAVTSFYQELALKLIKN
ncbi:MAG: TetR/AcrR family transcriptional regulator [Flavobacteriales bacterium]